MFIVNNNQWMIQLTLIKLHSNEYSQGLRYYPFAVNLAKCVRSCNTLNGTSYRVCIKKHKI